MSRKNLILALENEEAVDQTVVEGEGQEPVEEPVEEPATGDAIEQVPAEPEATPVEAAITGEEPAEELTETPAEAASEVPAEGEEPKEEAAVEQETGEEVTPEEGEAAAEVSEVISPESFEDEETEEATEETEETSEEVLSYVEEAYDDMQTLDAIQDTMERSVDEGQGLDETAAQIAEIAVEAIRTKLDIKTASQGSFSLESFKTKGTTRLDATRLAIEAIENEKQTIWQRIVAAFKLLLSKIVEFIGNIFDSLPILKKKLEKMKETLASATIIEPTDDSKHEASVGSKLAKAFNVDGKVDAKTVETISDNAIKFIEASVEASKQIAVAGHTLTQSLAHGKLLEADMFLKTMNMVVQPISQLNDLVLVNSQVIRTTQAQEELNKGKLGISIIPNAFSKAPDSEEVPVLSSKETQTMLENAINVIDQAIQYKGTMNKLKDVCNEIMKQKLPEVKSGEGMNVTEYSKGMMIVNHYIAFLSRLPITNAYQTANAIGAYAASNMKQMTGSTKEATA